MGRAGSVNPVAPFAAHAADDTDIDNALIQEFRQDAPAQDRGTLSIAASINRLRHAGVLMDDGTVDPARTARGLMRVGAVNLSVGRLWEGHVNALRLVRLYGSAPQRQRIADRIGTGAFLGVWGADGKPPVTLSKGGTQLAGGKAFASGLGTVTHAIVVIGHGPQTRLALLDVTDADRAKPEDWTMSGMRATVSGSYDFTDQKIADADWIGAPGDYLAEPHFVGGVWRIAALQAGAAIGLLDCAATALRERGRMDATAQKLRLAPVLARAWAGAALVLQAAKAIRSSAAKERIVATSIAARLMTEEVGLDAIRAVEQSIGVAHFDAGSQTGRMARDLSIYLRQAARDAFLERLSDHALGQDGTIWGPIP